MKIAKTIASVRRFRRQADRLVLVPTMGALHHGHAALIRRARQLAGPHGAVAVSIFVNPTQFGPKEDFSKYPRPWENDVRLCRAEGVDLVFAPSVEEMYADNRSISIEESSLSRYLCGATRPGHFQGVCTVVAKLFLITQPDVAIFGEKDWQQLAILRRLVRDLNFPVRIVGHPTIREPDGLAMSSRNAYLLPEERAVAPCIYAALRHAAGEASPRSILAVGRRLLAKIPGARLDYLSLVDAETLEPAKSLKLPMRLVVAVYLGKARLIDNIGISSRK